MTPAPHPVDEIERIAALHGLGVLDSAPEERFDRLTRLAKERFDAPIALVSLVDSGRQWFKSAQGLDARETSREFAFCAHAILDDGILVVPDATEDPRFADNPLVTGEPDIRFYAGAPLSSAEGHALGTLCVIDTEPRTWTDADSRALRDLADTVESELNQARRHDQQQALLALTAITALADTNPRDQLREALELGCEYLGLPIGIVSRIEGDDYEVMVQVSPDGLLTDGTHFPLASTYCELALGMDDVLAIAHMGTSDYAGHPCYDAFGLESYIGIATRVDDHLFGTLNFSSPDPRSNAVFAQADIDFVRIMGRWVAATLRRWELHEQLAQQKQIAEVIARAQSSFIQTDDRTAAFDGLLQDILAVTGCAYGFVGEVLHRPSGAPYLKTHAVTDISWNDETRAMFEQYKDEGLEFDNPDTLFGRTLTTGEPLLSNDPRNDPRRGTLPGGHPPLDSYLGLPVFHGGEMIGMVGLANKPGGFREADIDYLSPLLVTIGQLIEAWKTMRMRREDQRTVARLSLVARQMSNGVLITDGEGHVEWVNEGFTRMSGFTQEDLLTLRPREILHGPDSDPATEAAIFEAMAERRPFMVELLAYRKDGTSFWVELNSNPLHRSDGSLEGFMVMTSDITERKRIDKMKTEFVSTVSHELRTPLTSITGSLGLVARGVAGPLPDRAKDMLAIAHKNSERLSRLIDDLLDMEKLVEGKVRLDMAICELMPLVERAISENQSFADHFGVEIVCTARVGHALVDVDPLRLHQVLSNLMSNAAKFSEPRTEIEVSATASADGIRVEVTDHGRGIPVAFQPRIFEKFSQADGSDSRLRGGTGLGLAISKELIERMGGRIGFHSTEGVGSTFYFELPVATADFQV